MVAQEAELLAIEDRLAKCPPDFSLALPMAAFLISIMKKPAANIGAKVFAKPAMESSASRGYIKNAMPPSIFIGSVSLAMRIKKTTVSLCSGHGWASLHLGPGRRHGWAEAAL